MDPTQIAQALPSDPSSWGFILGGLVTAALAVDRFLQNRSGENKIIRAVTEDNARLENRAREAEARATASEAKADKESDERETLGRELAKIQAQYERLSERLEWLSKQNEELISQNKTLVQQNNELTSLLRGKAQ